MPARFRRRSISRRLSRASRGGARNRLYRRCRFSPHPYAA
ncbi:serine hydroxymethyltransferase [Burkholderia pseudomallei]|nr:serine hydroxymethyltransferase [Burkholderia pseudomallei]